MILIFLIVWIRGRKDHLLEEIELLVSHVPNLRWEKSEQGELLLRYFSDRHLQTSGVETFPAAFSADDYLAASPERADMWDCRSDEGAVFSVCL